MEIEEFAREIKKYVEGLSYKLTPLQIEQFYTYMQLLIQWNQKMNLTAICEPKEIILKHFIDSLTIESEIKDDQKVADIGTGAGFPGIPLSIIKPNTSFTLVDSLNKRLVFLEEVIRTLKIGNVTLVHARAEEFGQMKKEREQYDVVTSRAVASMNILLEYLLPSLKVGGICLCMKGLNIEEEKQQAQKALTLLGGKIVDIKSIILPNSEIKRNIIVVKKVFHTPTKYPRKPGTPTKDPL